MLSRHVNDQRQPVYGSRNNCYIYENAVGSDMPPPWLVWLGEHDYFKPYPLAREELWLCKKPSAIRSMIHDNLGGEEVKYRCKAFLFVTQIVRSEICQQMLLLLRFGFIEFTRWYKLLSKNSAILLREHY